MSESSRKNADDIPNSGSKTDKNGHNPIRTLIVGCGYLGLRVGHAAFMAGDQVYATTRQRDRANQLSAAGFAPLLVDWTDRRALHALRSSHFPVIDRVLVAVSYDRNGRYNRYDSQVGGLQNLLETLKSHQGSDGHLCYISTTGVYHQTDGRWVDESSPTHATREGGRVHLQAEALLRRYECMGSKTILRLAGIYGPGRVPRMHDVIAGRPIPSPESGYLNLIHVDDAASIVMSLWQRTIDNKTTQPLYVVADDQPVVRGEFYREIARQCRAAAPQFEAAPVDAPVSMRAESNKRIWNRQMKRDLLPRLRYPTYREGLAQILQSRHESGSIAT